MTPDTISRAPQASSGELRRLLRAHLVHTRDVANGKDFLFSGPAQPLHDALRQVTLIEQAREGEHLRLDFAEVGPFFLLRVIGGPAQQAEIAAFLEAEDQEAAR